MYNTNNTSDPCSYRSSTSTTTVPPTLQPPRPQQVAATTSPTRGGTTVLAVRQTAQTTAQTNAHTMTPDWDSGETLQNQKEDRILYDGDGTMPHLSPDEEDLVHEVLAMNTYAMQRCAEEDLGAAITILEDALARLQPNTEEDPQATVIQDAQVLDQLQSTTLNNMGVVESHRGRARQAIRYFEAARKLEDAWGMASPSLALNTCAAYNTLGMYEKATAAALETIDMLRALEVQRQRDARIARRQQALETMTAREAALAARENEADQLEAASEVRVASSDNKALWGAAWHNLGVAQINTARKAVKESNTNVKKDQSEYTNALKILQNAMQATQDLLGADHPMYKAVVETYRAVRQTLRDGGAFKQHRTLMTAPLPPVDPRLREMELRATQPAPGATRQRTFERNQKDLTITFRGQVTEQQKLIERTDQEPYPNAARSRFHRRGYPAPRGGNRKQRQLRGTLRDADALYGSHSRHQRALLSHSAPPGRDRDAMLPPLITEHMSGSRPHGSRTPPPFLLTFDGSSTQTTAPAPPPPQEQQPQQKRQSTTMGTQTQAVEPAPAPAPAPAPVFTDSARFLLLASAPATAAVPPSPAQAPDPAPTPPRKQTSDGGVQTEDVMEQAATTAAAPFAPSPRSSPGGSPANYTTPSPHRTQVAVGEDAATNTPVAGSSPSHSQSQPHRNLFDAMWVTADERYINQGKRNFDVPAYFVPDVEDRARENLRRASGSAPRAESSENEGGAAGSATAATGAGAKEEPESEDSSAIFIAPNKEFREL